MPLDAQPQQHNFEWLPGGAVNAYWNLYREDLEDKFGTAENFHDFLGKQDYQTIARLAENVHRYAYPDMDRKEFEKASGMRRFNREYRPKSLMRTATQNAAARGIELTAGAATGIRIGAEKVNEILSDRQGGFPALRSVEENLKLAGENVRLPAKTSIEEILDGDVKKVLPFIVEHGIASAPDMVLAMASVGVGGGAIAAGKVGAALIKAGKGGKAAREAVKRASRAKRTRAGITGAYGAGIAGDVANERAVNNNMETATGWDLIAGMPTATAVVALDRIGALGIVKSFKPKNIVEKAKKGWRDPFKRVGAAAAREAGTEAVQETIEGIGSGAGTERWAGMDQGQIAGELGKGALSGALVGAGLGAGITGVGEAYRGMAKDRAEDISEDIAENPESSVPPLGLPPPAGNAGATGAAPLPPSSPPGLPPPAGMPDPNQAVITPAPPKGPGGPLGLPSPAGPPDPNQAIVTPAPPRQQPPLGLPGPPKGLPPPRQEGEATDAVQEDGFPSDEDRTVESLTLEEESVDPANPRRILNPAKELRPGLKVVVDFGNRPPIDGTVDENGDIIDDAGAFVDIEETPVRLYTSPPSKEDQEADRETARRDAAIVGAFTAVGMSDDPDADPDSIEMDFSPGNAAVVQDAVDALEAERKGSQFSAIPAEGQSRISDIIRKGKRWLAENEAHEKEQERIRKENEKKGRETKSETPPSEPETPPSESEKPPSVPEKPPSVPESEPFLPDDVSEIDRIEEDEGIANTAIDESDLDDLLGSISLARKPSPKIPPETMRRVASAKPADLLGPAQEEDLKNKYAQLKAFLNHPGFSSFSKEKQDAAKDAFQKIGERLDRHYAAKKKMEEGEKVEGDTGEDVSLEEGAETKASDGIPRPTVAIVRKFDKESNRVEVLFMNFENINDADAIEPGDAFDNVRARVRYEDPADFLIDRVVISEVYGNGAARGYAHAGAVYGINPGTKNLPEIRYLRQGEGPGLDATPEEADDSGPTGPAPVPVQKKESESDKPKPRVYTLDDLDIPENADDLDVDAVLALVNEWSALVFYEQRSPSTKAAAEHALNSVFVPIYEHPAFPFAPKDLRGDVRKIMDNLNREVQSLLDSQKTREDEDAESADGDASGIGSSAPPPTAADPNVKGEGGIIEGETGTKGTDETNVDEGIKFGEVSEDVVIDETEAEMGGAFVPFEPNYPIEGSQPHADKIVEPSVLAGIRLPKAVYPLQLDEGSIPNGIFSEVQLDAIVAIVNRWLPRGGVSPIASNGERVGFLLADGTGVGKGREISGLIMDTMHRTGNRKAVWISQNKSLIRDARRDVRETGLQNRMPVLDATDNQDFDRNLYMRDEKGRAKSRRNGIAFLAYSTVAGTDRGKWSWVNNDRVMDLVKWLGEDFDGVIAFDESHNMANVGKNEDATAASRAQAARDLQRRLKKARIVYVSATGATKPNDLAYLDRIGLHGPGTPFVSADGLVHRIGRGGNAMMELVARHMKQVGAFLSRNISYEGVRFQTLEHRITDETGKASGQKTEQQHAYDEATKAWREVQDLLNEATYSTSRASGLDIKEAEFEAKKKQSVYWGQNQDFFMSLISALMAQTAVAKMKEDVAKGYAPVVQITKTNEAADSRQRERTGGDESKVERTPLTILEDFILSQFPVYKYVVDPKTKKVMYPDDKNKLPKVVNPEAMALRERALQQVERLKEMNFPTNALDQILMAFPGEVAEVTGRKDRGMMLSDGTWVTERGRTDEDNEAETEQFNQGRKKVLVFSRAGGTGASYHADRRIPNQKQRVHYILEPGWEPTGALQGFGRTHRTNQAQPPIYQLVTIDIPGVSRITSTIAARLSSFGALRGDRKASTGVFDEKSEIDDRYGSEALTHMAQIISDPGIRVGTDDRFVADLGRDIQSLQSALGTGPLEKIAVKTFLNRILNLEIREQQLVFDKFLELRQRAIEHAIELGRYTGGGTETISHMGARFVDEEVLNRDPRAGNMKLVTISHKRKIMKRMFAEEARFHKSGDVWVVRKSDGKVGHSSLIALDRKGGKVQGRRIFFADGDTELIEINRFDEKFHAITPGWGGFMKGGDGPTEPQFRETWDKQYKDSPDVKEFDLYLLTGAVFPVLDRLSGLATVQAKRIKLDDGKQYLGVQIRGKKKLQQVRDQFYINENLQYESAFNLLDAIRPERKRNKTHRYPSIYEFSRLARLKYDSTDGEKRFYIDNLQRSMTIEEARVIAKKMGATVEIMTPPGVRDPDKSKRVRHEKWKAGKRLDPGLTDGDFVRIWLPRADPKNRDFDENRKHIDANVAAALREFMKDQVPIRGYSVSGGELVRIDGVTERGQTSARRETPIPGPRYISRKRTAELTEMLKRILARLAPGVTLETFETESNVTGRFYTDGLEAVVEVALNADQDPRKTIGETAFQALWAMGLITTKEKRALVAAAKKGKWIQKHKIKERYPHLFDDGFPSPAAYQQAIADEFSDYITMRRGAGAGSLVRRVFDRVVEFFVALSRGLRNLDAVPSTNNIFAAIERGDVGRRGLNISTRKKIAAAKKSGDKTLVSKSLEKMSQEEINKKLLEIAERMIPGVPVSIDDRPDFVGALGLFSIGNDVSEGLNPATGEIVIQRGMGYHESVKTLKHEIIHALRRLNIITANEWAALKRASVKENWFEKYGIFEKYRDDPGAYEHKNGKYYPKSPAVEEAIAFHFMNWAMNPDNVKATSRMQKIFEKMMAFLDDVREWVNLVGANLYDGKQPTWQEVFYWIDKGVVGGRGFQTSMQGTRRSREGMKGEITSEIPNMTSYLKKKTKAPPPKPETLSHGVEFASRDSEIRWREASKGIDESRLRKLQDDLASSWNSLTRTFRHLAKKPEYSELRERLGYLKNAPHTGKERVLSLFRNLSKGISKDDWDLVVRKWVLDDLLWTAEQGREIPFGLKSVADVRNALDDVEAALNKRADLLRVVSMRNIHRTNLTSEMVRVGVLTKKEAENGDYYRHMVIEYAQVRKAAGGGEKVGNPFWHGRKGSELDINANYFQAEADWMLKAYNDIETRKFLNWFEKHSGFDMSAELKRRAREENRENLFGILEDPVRGKNGQHKTTWKRLNRDIAIAMKMLRSNVLKSGIHLDKIGGGLDAAMDAFLGGKGSVSVMDDEGDAKFFALVSWLAENGPPEVQISAYRVFKTINARSAFQKMLLGDAYIDVTDKRVLAKRYVRETHRAWQPDSYDGKTRKLHIFSAKTVSQRVLETVMGGLADIVGDPAKSGMNKSEVEGLLNFLGDKATNMRMLGGPMKELIIPKDIADQLDDFGDPPLEAGISKMAARATSSWKQWTLFNPWRLIPYNLNNISGEIEVLIQSGTFLGTWSKRREAHRLMWDMIYHNKIDETMQLALDYNIVQSALTTQEVTSFEEAVDPTDVSIRRPQGVVSRGVGWYFDQAKNISRYREGLVRLANFLYIKEQLEEGKEFRDIGLMATPYSMADELEKKEAERGDTRNMLAARLSRDIMGDYGMIPHTAQFLRRIAIPFLSFQASNAIRYGQMVSNLVRKIRDAGWRGAAPSAAAMTAMLLARTAFFYTLIWTWNNLMFPDEEELLTTEQKIGLHLHLSRGDNLVMLRFPGAFSDIAGYFGMEDVAANIMEARGGRMTAMEATAKTAKDIPKAFLNKTVNSINPIFKLAVEYPIGESLFPDATDPRAVYNMSRHIAKTVSLEGGYAWGAKLLGQPETTKPLLEGFANFVVKTKDRGEVAYNTSKKWAWDYRDRVRGRSDTTRRSEIGQLVYQLKRARAMGDTMAERNALKKLREAGYRMKKFRQSINRSSVLGGLNKQEKKDFMRSLSPEQRAIVRQGNRWYRQTASQRASQ